MPAWSTTRPLNGGKASAPAGSAPPRSARATTAADNQRGCMATPTPRPRRRRHPTTSPSATPMPASAQRDQQTDPRRAAPGREVEQERCKYLGVVERLDPTRPLRAVLVWLPLRRQPAERDREGHDGAGKNEQEEQRRRDAQQRDDQQQQRERPAPVPGQEGVPELPPQVVTGRIVPFRLRVQRQRRAEPNGRRDHAKRKSMMQAHDDPHQLPDAPPPPESPPPP